MIKAAPSPWKTLHIAKDNKHKRRKDWDDVKVGFMEELLRLKLAQNEDVQQALENTGSRMIYENSPFDDFWKVGPNGNGKNMMGKLWVKIRDGKE